MFLIAAGGQGFGLSGKGSTDSFATIILRRGALRGGERLQVVSKPVFMAR
jgi:hypothetical protein